MSNHLVNKVLLTSTKKTRKKNIEITHQLRLFCIQFLILSALYYVII